MNPRAKSTLVMVVTLAAVGTVAGILVLRVNAGEKAAVAAPPAPATATKAVKESDLNVLTLTADAARRLDVQTAAVERRAVRRHRTFGGEVVVPPGRAVIVSAPVAGTLRPAGAVPATGPATAPATGPAAAASFPMVGTSVETGQSVLQLVPLLTAEARTTMTASLVDAEGLVRNAEVQVRAAGVTLARAKQLVADQAGSQRAVDDAQAQADLAREGLEAAQARRDLLARTTQGADAGGSAPPLAIASPATGVLRDVRVAAGQVVSAGAPLFEVVDASRVWVRVAVYAGEAADVAADAPATVAPLGGRGDRGGAQGPTRTARPVAAPPSGNPLASTVDLYYEADNADGKLRPGERLAVGVPLGGADESLVVPWSAVTFDVHGGTWVYEMTGPLQYARRRVEVRHVDGGQAVLATGPPAGTVVVTQGVAELFGREMGYAK